MHDADTTTGFARDAAMQRMLLGWLLRGEHLARAVAAALEIVEHDPLATSGCFRGALLRGLMEVPGGYWSRQPQLYERYVRALRASALARRALPHGERMEFWTPFDAITAHGITGTPDTPGDSGGATTRARA